MSSATHFDSLPFVLGVSGHLDIASSDKKDLHKALVARLKTYQSKLGLKIKPYIATGLARGADQLAARAALEAGWGLIAVLPMPAHEFLATDDFMQHPDAAHEFKELLSLAKEHVITLGTEKITVFDEGIQSRNDQLYRNQSSFLAFRCTTVLALWDGVPAGIGACGTSYVVQICRGELLTQQLVWGDKVTKHLDIVKVRRTDSQVEVEPMSPLPPKDIVRFFAEIRELTAIKAWISDQRVIEESKYALLDNEEQRCDDAEQINQTRWAELDDGSKTILQTYTRMDLLSRHFQQRRSEVIKYTTIMAAMGGSIQFVSSIIQAPLLLGISWALILISAGLAYWFLSDKYSRYHNKFTDLRVLAESLRIQFYWRIAGIEKDIFDAFENRTALSEVGFLSFLSGIKVHVMSSNTLPPSNPEMVHSCWVLGQKQYFENKLLMLKKQQSQIKLCKYLLLFLAAASYLLGQFLINLSVLGIPANKFGQSLTALFVFLLALLSNYNTVMHFENLLRSYEAQFKVFDAAKQLISDAWRDNDVYFRQSQYIRRIGALAMQENADWFRNQREKQFDYKKLAGH